MKLKALNKKYQIALLVIAIMLVISGVSYAYFAVTATGTSNNNIVTSGTMKITFTDGPQISLENAIPGDTLTKTFSVTNTGNVATNYDIFLSDIVNTFADSSDLVYTLTSTNGANVTETVIPTISSKIVSNQSIDVDETQTYTLTIKFLNKNQAQDSNQGKMLSAKIQINTSSSTTNDPYNDINVIAYYNNEVVTDIPSNDGTKLVYNISCTNDAIGTWNTTNWNLTLNMAKFPVKCDVYFGDYKNFTYTGNEQTFTANTDGYYELETWGAQGGTAGNGTGGYGAYSVGLTKLTAGQTVYVNGGGTTSSTAGGYNGGGTALYVASTGATFRGGGGATDMATTSGLLEALSANQSSVLIVAAGGGGGGYINATWRGTGGNGGGYIGNTGFNYGTNNTALTGTGGTQTAGGHNYNTPTSGVGTFGKGSNYYNDGYGGNGGGGGWYGGGGSSRYHAGGGGGSSYIGSSLLVSSSTITKSMTCYSCATSTDSNTNTITTTNVSDTAVSNYAKTGNGYAKITYVGASLD